MPTGLSLDKWGFEDLSFFDEVLNTSKAARVALASLSKEYVEENKHVEPECKSIDAIFAACERMPQAAFFAIPVDPVELEIPDYFDIIKHPMDMGTIKKHLDGGRYVQHELFAEHMRLTFNNAYTYNHMEDNPVHVAAREMEALFNSLYEPFVAALKDTAIPERDVLQGGLSSVKKAVEEHKENESMSRFDKGISIEPVSEASAPSPFSLVDYVPTSGLIPVKSLHHHRVRNFMVIRSLSQVLQIFRDTDACASLCCIADIDNLVSQVFAFYI